MDTPTPFIHLGADGDEGSPQWCEWAKRIISSTTEHLDRVEVDLASTKTKLKDAETALAGVRIYLVHRRGHTFDGPRPGDTLTVLPLKVKGRVLETVMVESGKIEYLVSYWHGGGPVTVRLRSEQVSEESILPPPEKP